MKHSTGFRLSLLIGLVGFGFRLFLISSIESPFLFYDEMTGPAVARWLAGTSTDVYGVSGQPLYGALLAPFAAFGEPAVLHKSALILNAALFSLLAPVLYRVGRVVFESDPPVALAGAAAGSLAAATHTFSIMVVPEALLTLLVPLMILASKRLETGSSVAELPVLTALAVMTHGRGVVLGIAVILTALVMSFQGGPLPRRRTITLIVGTLIAIAASMQIGALVKAEVFVESSPATLGMSSLAANSIQNPLLVVRSAVGTGWYAVVATGGLAVVGAAEILLRSLTGERRFANVFSGLSIVGVAAFSTLLVSRVMVRDGRRVDVYGYGRYLEFVLPVLLLAAAAAWQRQRSFRLTTLVLAGLTSIAGVVVAGAVYDDSFWTGPNAQSNVSGLQWLRFLDSDALVLSDAGAAIPLASGACVLALLLAWRRLPTAAVTVAIVLGMVSGYQIASVWARDAGESARIRAEAGIFLDESGVDEITVPLDSIEVLGLQLVTFWSPDLTITIVDTLEDVDGSEAEYVLTRTGVSPWGANFEVFFEDPRGEMLVWRSVS